MFGITTHLCGLQCLKVQLTVPPSMPVSSSKVQGKIENWEGGVKGDRGLEKGGGLRNTEARHREQGKISSKNNI